MTELDFDELDKAVNSLMAENGTPETEMPAQDGVATVASSSQPTPTTPVVSPAVRRRGQFMDVMHPSANMRTAPAPVKGQGMTTVPPTTQEAITPDTEPIPEVVSPTASDSPQEPLVTSEPVVTPVEEEMNSVPSANVPEPSLEIIPSEPQSSDDSSTSPFLPDAKVEKRPLGTAAPFVDPTPPVPAEEKSSIVDPLGPPPVIPAPDKAEEIHEDVKPDPIPLPDELKDDVVAVEANEVVHDDVATETSPQETPGMPLMTDTPSVGGNIVQQYEEQPSTGDQTNGAIYDTNTYHQALEANPVKKKSHVLAWVLWIIVLLIVGATAGAAWFYFTTQ